MMRISRCLRRVLPVLGIIAGVLAGPAAWSSNEGSPFGDSPVRLQDTPTPAVVSESDTEASADMAHRLEDSTKRLEAYLKALESRQPPCASPTTSLTHAQAAQPPAVTQGAYTVAQGDSLWKIASRFLGTGTRYWDLVEANKERYPSLAKNPDLIHPGWILTIPGADVPPTSGPATGPRTPTPGPAPSSSFTPSTSIPAPDADARGGKALLAWLQRAGLTGETLRTAWAIGMAESSGNPRAFNGDARTGDKSYGLFQINMLGNLGPARLRQYNLNSNEDLFDPEVNIRVMIQMSRNGTNWRPWSVYKRGTYRQWLSRYPP